jgi:tetratricopeptide (TPR) repeat protein
MKKVLFSMFFVGVATLANAQKSEVAEAKKAWDLFQINPTASKSLDKAILALNNGLKHSDLAIANEKSKILPEAWSYRALLASGIAVIDSVDVNNAMAKQKIAEEAIEKGTALDVKGAEKDNFATAKINIRNAINGRGVRAYNKKDFAAANKSFNELLVLYPSDTTTYVNAGVTAKMIKNYPEAIKHFKKVISFNVPETKGFHQEIVAIALNDLKDTTQTLELIKEALIKYPDDPAFVSIATDIYIKKGDIAKSQELLQKLIAKDQTKAVYHHLYGDTYFQQALALQDVRAKIDVKKVKEFDAVTAKMNAFIDQAIPHYKKAIELDPKFASSLENLSRIYAFKGDTKTYEEYNKRLKALPAN